MKEGEHGTRLRGPRRDTKPGVDVEPSPGDAPPMSDGAPFEPRPPATPARRRWRLVVPGRVAGLLAVVVWHYATLEAVKHGDGWEYAYQLESLSRHGTPELRDEDLAAANARFTPASWKSPPAHPYGYFPAPDG